MTLIEWRKDKKYSQKKAAKLLGVDQSVLCRWEKRERAPSLENVKTILKVTRGKVKLTDLG